MKNRKGKEKKTVRKKKKNKGRKAGRELEKRELKNLISTQGLFALKFGT